MFAGFNLSGGAARRPLPAAPQPVPPRSAVVTR
jgi:hypothetical protein